MASNKVESGAARIVNSSLKAFTIAMRRETGISGSTLTNASEEGLQVSISMAKVTTVNIMAKILPIRVHGSGFFIPSNLDGSTGALTLPLMRKKSLRLSPINRRNAKITTAGVSLKR